MASTSGLSDEQEAIRGNNSEGTSIRQEMYDQNHEEVPKKPGALLVRGRRMLLPEGPSSEGQNLQTRTIRQRIPRLQHKEHLWTRQRRRNIRVK